MHDAPKIAVVRISVGLPVNPQLTGEQLVDCATTAERLGFDAVNLTDHPAPPQSWLDHGGHHTVDPFVGLAVAATVTTRLRLHTNVIVLGYRNPLLLAKSVRSLDRLSNGRLVLGVGVGYLREEFDVLGAEFDGRGVVADETLRALTADLAGDDRQPPIWVGGNSKAAMRRTVEYGAGWAPMPSPAATKDRLGTPGLDDIDVFRQRVAELYEMATAAGRSDRPDIIAIPKSMSGFSRGPWESAQAIDEIGNVVDAGATALAIELRTSDPSTWIDEATRFAEDVLPQI